MEKKYSNIKSYLEYQDFASIYDSLWNYKADLPLWSKFAKLSKGEILELSCGTGRVSIFLAKKGYKITGIDISDNMLNIGRKKVKKLNLTNKIKMIQGDIFDFNLRKKFNLVIIPLSSFYYGQKKLQKINCLKNIYKHLNKGGYCVIDNYRYTVSSPLKRMPLAEIKNGPEVYSKIDVYKKSGKPYKAVEKFFYITKNEKNKVVSKKNRTVTCFLSSPEEVIGMAKKVGFNVQDILSNYGGEKKGARDFSKDRDIFVLQKS